MRTPTLYAGPKGNGKTTTLLAWLFGGERVDGYPGWSRVLLVPGPGVEHVEELKPAFKAMAEAKAESEDVETPEWAELDFAHRVYTVAEWQKAGNLVPDTELAIDGIDRIPWRLEEMRGTVVMMAMWDEVDVRDPEQGMSIPELAEHAQAADQRYGTLRQAVRDLGLKPGRLEGERVVGGNVVEGARLHRENLTRLAHLYFAAAEYDWLHPGEEVLAPPAEGHRGVAPYGIHVTKTQMLAELDRLRRSIEEDDSFEGSLAYEITTEGPDSEEAEFLLQAALRVGNSMGQGGLRLLRTGLESPEP